MKREPLLLLFFLLPGCAHTPTEPRPALAPAALGATAPPQMPAPVVLLPPPVQAPAMPAPVPASAQAPDVRQAVDAGFRRRDELAEDQQFQAQKARLITMTRFLQESAKMDRYGRAFPVPGSAPDGPPMPPCPLTVGPDNTLYHAGPDGSYTPVSDEELRRGSAQLTAEAKQWQQAVQEWKDNKDRSQPWEAH